MNTGHTNLTNTKKRFIMPLLQWYRAFEVSCFITVRRDITQPTRRLVKKAPTGMKTLLVTLSKLSKSVCPITPISG